MRKFEFLRQFVFSKRVVLSTLLLIVYGFAALSLAGCGEQSVKAIQTEENYIAVKTHAAGNGKIAREYKYSGYLKPVKEVNVSSKAVGEINEVYFDVGDKVKKGEILFTMDNYAAENNVKALENQLDSQINQVKSALESAKTQLQDAENTYTDMTALYDNGAISQQEVDAAKFALDHATIAYESAKKSYDLLVNDETKSSLIAQIDNSKENLEDLMVRSPIDGVISSRSIEEGEIVSNMPAFSIVNLAKVTLEISVPENIINKVTLNQSVDVNVNVIGDITFKGRVTSISPVADRGTMTYPVKVEIDNSNGTIKSGMYAEAVIIGEKKDNVLLIPRNSLQFDGEQKYVYVVENDKAKRIYIETGLDNGAEIEITKGIAAGANIIVKGQSYVADGAKVLIVE